MIEIPDRLLESPEPFCVCSRSVLGEQVRILKRLGVDVFFSVKTNPERAILKELCGLGVGFSVSSPGEFLSATSAGADRICYYERGLTKERAEWLVQSGCSSYAVDSRAAFENLKAAAREGLTILVRVKSDKADNRYPGDYAPGVEPAEAERMIEECRGLGAKVGILHHSASQIEDPAVWKRKFEELSRFNGVEIIDIGGGMPVSYSGGGQEEVMAEIEDGVKGLKAESVIAEPGRFIVGPACSLITKVALVDGNDAVLNCSVYDAHIDTILAGLVLPCRTLKDGPLEEYRLLGSSLCSLDVFNERMELPRLSPGDVVVFDNAGAYNFSSDFSSGSGKTHMVG